MKLWIEIWHTQKKNEKDNNMENGAILVIPN